MSFASLLGQQHASLRNRVLQSKYKLVFPEVDQSDVALGDEVQNTIRTKCQGWHFATALDPASPSHTLFTVHSADLTQDGRFCA